jgi:hypothetical protein
MLARDTFLSRYRYLRLEGRVAEETFGNERYLNQRFYTSRDWKVARDVAIVRDGGRDLGHPDYPILGKISVHHIEPVTAQQLLEGDPKIFDPDNLICVSHNTHNAIHYGDESLLPKDDIERKPGDTLLWERSW